MYCKHIYYIFKYFYKVDYTIFMFIHVPIFSYNKVMCILHLACIAEPK